MSETAPAIDADRMYEDMRVSIGRQMILQIGHYALMARRHAETAPEAKRDEVYRSECLKFIHTTANQFADAIHGLAMTLAGGGGAQCDFFANAMLEAINKMLPICLDAAKKGLGGVDVFRPDGSPPDFDFRDQFKGPAS
jgi:hypothetical protein